MSGSNGSRWTKTIYRLRNFPDSFNEGNLSTAIEEAYQVQPTDLKIHSFSLDIKEGNTSRQKVATVTFRDVPAQLRESAEQEWSFEIAPDPSHICRIYLDTHLKGLTPLTPVANEETCEVDCIFVHGWGGNALGSLVADDPTYVWLRDDLPSRFPNLRIWTYGYGAKLTDENHVSDPFEYAERLKDALRSFRNISERERPIIFLVHSLGGLILKQTLISMSKGSNADDKKNLQLVIGALFFGVPEQGMDVAAIESMTYSLPSQYVSSLLNENFGHRQRDIQDEEFYRIWPDRGFCIIPFFEMRKTLTPVKIDGNWSRTGTPSLLVKASSATTGRYNQQDRVKKISLDKDHHGIIKFSRNDQEDYRKVCKELQDLVDNVPNVIKSRMTDSLVKNSFKIPFSLGSMPTSKKFIERPLEMRMMSEALLPRPEISQRKIFVLRGLGGIGKTQLAVQFMRVHHSKFSAVFWLDGSSEDSLKRDIANLASKISPDQISDVSRAYVHDAKGDIDAVISEVLAWFAKASNNKWLLIFDNVDRDSDSSEKDLLAYDVMRFVPSADHGSVLITTRLTRLEQLGESMEVRKVDQRTARNILESWYKKATYDENEVVRLLEYLDGLPLAIAQAGAYLQESGMNLDTYLQMYEERRQEVAELLHGSSMPLRDYPGRSVWTTWIISYDAILAQNEHVAHLLVLWSFLDHSDLWYGIFEEAAIRKPSISQALSKWLGNVTDDSLSFADAMTLLRSYSLIEGSDHGDGYIMHAVVHRWAYFYRGLQCQLDMGMLALAIVGGAVPMYAERDYARLQQRLLPHAQVCCARALNEQATINRSTGHDNVSPQKEDILYAIHMLGLLYHDQGKLEEAEKMYMRALQGKEALGAKHTLTLNTVNNLGLLYYDQGKLDEAEKMYVQALQGRKEAVGAEHIPTLHTVNNLGLLYTDQGKLSEAEKLLLRALQGYEEVLGAKHTSTLNTVNNLGNLYKNQGKLSEAEKMYVRALQGKEEALGIKHTSTLNTVNNLGNLYKNQGKLSKAEKMYVRALQGYEEALGTELVKTYIPALNTMTNLGDLYSKILPDESQAMYAKALSGYVVVRGVSSDIYLDVKSRLDASNISPRQDATNPVLSHLLLAAEPDSNTESSRGTKISSTLTVEEISSLRSTKTSSSSTIDNSTNDSSLSRTGFLAYLSACSTAEHRVARLLDENLTIGSAFQATGFAHVIGHLWPAWEYLSADFARWFWAYMVEFGVIDVNGEDGDSRGKENGGGGDGGDGGDDGVVLRERRDGLVAVCLWFATWRTIVQHECLREPLF